MKLKSPSIRFGAALAVLAAVTLCAGRLYSEQVGNKGELKAWERSFRECKEYLAKAKELDEDMKDAARKIADEAAKFYIYRITHRGDIKFSQVHSDFDTDMEAAKKGKNKEFKEMLAPCLVQSMKDVLGKQDLKKDREVIASAAVMLPSMAKIRHEKVGEYLVELIKEEKTSPPVRYYAIKALKEQLPITVQPANADANPKSDEGQKRQKEADYVDVLTKVIETKINVNGMVPEEVEAHRFVRRAALESLSAARSPAVHAGRLGGKAVLQGPVAPTLLKVLVKGALTPEPNLQDKIEAALGLCIMEYPNAEEYNPELATFLIGQTLAEFAAAYSDEWAVIDAGKKTPSLPYKSVAERFKKNLAIMAKLPDPDGKKLASTADKLLDKIKLHKELQDADVDAFREKLPRQPKATKAFKKLDTPEILKALK